MWVRQFIAEQIIIATLMNADPQVGEGKALGVWVREWIADQTAVGVTMDADPGVGSSWCQ